MILDLALDATTLREWAFRDRPGSDPAWARLEAARAAGAVRLWTAVSSLAAALAAPNAPASPGTSVDAPSPETPASAGEAGDASSTESAGPRGEAGPMDLRTLLSERLREAVGNALRPFTVDARSAVEAAAEGWEHLDASLALSAFRRLAPAGFLVTRDAAARARLKGTRLPAEAAAALDASEAPKTVPMLDLREEYRLHHAGLDRALLSTAASAQYILGPQVARFEEELAGWLGAGRAVGASSGTEALVLALRALAMARLGRERFASSDYIVTTPFTFVATGDAILRAGATPLFADIDPATLNLDPESVRRCLRNPPGRVVGLIPVHLFGKPCPMDDLLALSAEHGLFVLEDVAQAFGARWRGRRLGTLGEAAAFSFFPSKNLGSMGDAGAVAASDPALAESVSQLLKHGGRGKGTFETLGYNARLDTLQAAALLDKLPRVDACNLARRAVAAAYVDALTGVGDLVLPERPDGDPFSHVFHQFTMRTGRRDALQARLAGDGIASMLYYPHPLHRMPLFAGRCATAEGRSLPAAERAAAEVLSLPIGPAQRPEAAAAVIASVRRFFAP